MKRGVAIGLLAAAWIGSAFAVAMLARESPQEQQRQAGDGPTAKDCRAVADVSATHIQHPPPLIYISDHDSGPSDAGLAWSPDGRKLAFVSYRGFGRGVGRDIYVMNADGSGVDRLTLFGIVGWAKQPAWSPDGQRIAFGARKHDNAEVYVMNADGSGVERLTYSDATGFAENPIWSPDGRRIAFAHLGVSGRRVLNWEIYAMNADGSGVERLTYSPSNYGVIRSYDHEPAWSPDGRRIAFVSGRDGNPEIYAMNADCSGVERLTDSDGTDSGAENPVWSPDGQRIAFVSRGWEIYAMNADGSGGGCLAYSSDQPAWSPDGRRLAFGSGQYGDGWAIYAMNADGSGVERLTSFASAPSNQPAWSPDGQRIAFVSRHDGLPAIYVVAVDARPR